MNLKGRIEDLCEEKGMTVKTLEQVSGIPAGSISKWNTSIPSIQKVALAAEGLGVTIDRLWYGDESEEPKKESPLEKIPGDREFALTVAVLAAKITRSDLQEKLLARLSQLVAEEELSKVSPAVPL